MKPNFLVTFLCFVSSAFFAQVQTIADYMPGTYLEYHRPVPPAPNSGPGMTVLPNSSMTLQVCGMQPSMMHLKTRTLTLTKNRYARLSIDHSYISYNNSGPYESDYVEYGKWSTSADTLVITFSKVEGAFLPESRIIVCTPAKNGQLPLIERVPLVPVRKYLLIYGHLKEIGQDSVQLDRQIP